MSLDANKITQIAGLSFVALIAAAAGARQHGELKRAIARLNKFELSVADAVANSLPKADANEPKFGFSGQRSMPWSRKASRGRQALGGYNGDADWLDDDADCGCPTGRS